jgi:Protein of unknown function (DUF3618)
MDPTRDGTSEDVRVAAVRRDVELARKRIAETIHALEHKADVPTRLADVLSAAASRFTARVLERIPSPSRPAADTAEGAGAGTPPATG